MQKNVSVIMPAYSERGGSPKAVEDMPAVVGEIMVVNDCTTDNTVDVLKKFKDFRKVNLDMNHSPASAMNIGIYGSVNYRKLSI